jgi:hypothetical protein
MGTMPPPVRSTDSGNGTVAAPLTSRKLVTQRTRTIREIERHQMDALERTLTRGR